MSETLTYDAIGEQFKRGHRTLVLYFKGHMKPISMPGWYREDSDEGVHSEEDMIVSDIALAELKHEVESSDEGAPRSENGLIQVVEDRLKIGKRAVRRGRVRVYSYVVETSVSEDVTLRGETVSVDRRVVDRLVSAAAFDVDPFKERTIEMEEFSEEAVVAKSAHIVEEIGIRKETTDRVETVHETLRRTVVDINDARLGGTVAGTLGRFATEIRDDMEVVGSDGLHVGIVDHMEDGRIKLKKVDASSSGEHHYLRHDMVQSVADKVLLAVTAAEARSRWAKT